MGLRNAGLMAALVATTSGAALAQWIEIEVSTPHFANVIGQPITIEAEIRWEGGAALGAVQGSIIVTPASGNADNFTSDLVQGGLVNFGTFDGFSRVGFEAFQPPPMFLGGMLIPPWSNNTGITIARYDIHTFTPGIYYARWVPDAPNQGVHVYLNTSSITPLNAPTSNISTRFFVGCCPGPICPADLTTTANPAHASYGAPGAGLNNDDFFFFVARFALGDRGVCDITAGATPGTPGYGFPNGVLNNDDFFHYLNVFAEGC